MWLSWQVKGIGRSPASGTARQALPPPLCSPAYQGSSRGPGLQLTFFWCGMPASCLPASAGSSKSLGRGASSQLPGACLPALCPKR